ncbi:helix-turn-helix domain-containing protein [Caulobacter hibisci]|uniref:Helix-turn-helix domain-containing protein n=1 Tax=Caulobacter hibisci TaxID=2035993 RepID=A0ABS0T0I3_9CAUL|nr:helix-turn-helix domain-containing protein [Caulobacter hibisci]
MHQDPIPPSDRSAGPERLAYRIKEAAEVLAISRSRLYELVAAGEIRVLKDGSRTLVRRSELQAYLDRLETAPNSSPRTLAKRTSRRS